MARKQGSPNQQGGQSTPVRLALAGHTMYRDSGRDKDKRFINCYQESIKDELSDSKKSYVVKRAGLVAQQTTEAAEGRGIEYYNGKFYSVVEDALYENGTSIFTLSTTTGRVGFCHFDQEGISYLFLCDGTDGYVIDSSSAVTQVNVTYTAWVAATNYAVGDKRIPTTDNGFYYEVTADAGSSGGSEPSWPTVIGDTVVDSGITWTCKGAYGGFPSPHIPTPKFFDGYMLLPRADSADVYNADLDNIYGWSAANFFTAEMWPDNITNLMRQNNMAIAFGKYSGEFYYDAATTGGSPFQRNESAALQMGCAAPYATCEQERFCLFIGQSQTGGRAVWLIEGFNPKKVSTEYIERILDAEGSSILTATGYGLRSKGHLLYVINLTSTTIVYDIEEKVWHEWQSGGSSFSCSGLADKEDGTPYLQHKTNGTIYKLSPTTYQDDGVAINVDIYTAPQDYDTMNRKFMHNVSVVGDQQTGDTLTLYWSDNDYQTWSAGKVLSRATRSIFSRVGSFRRRAFRINHTGNYPFRVESIEAEVDVGYS